MSMWALPYFLVIRLHRYALDARRRERTWRYLAWSMVAGVMAAILVWTALFLAWVMWQVGWWPLAIVLVVMFALPPLTPITMRHVFVPLGWVRAAFWAGHFASSEDSDALAMCCAAWAHARKPTPAGEAWICARRDRRQPLGDAEIVVTGFLAAARGDADAARGLLRSIDWMVERHPAVRELAGEWLAVDAVERGAWAELAADATAARYPATSLTYFLEGLACGKGRGEMWARWVMAPHRVVTWRLMQTGFRPPASGFRPEADAVAKPEGAPFPAAVAAHLRVSAAITKDQLATTVAAWDAALADEATKIWLAKRALELDAPLGAVDRALREVATAVTDELARVADAAKLGSPPSHGLVGEALARRLRHGRLDALEAAFTRWENRKHDGEYLPAIDEWREFIALRAAYDAAATAGGLELRRLAFPHAYKTGNAMAVWLWNKRKEYALSHAISVWLLAEAMAVGDTEAIELCTRNTRLGVPTRTGEVKP